MENKNTRNDYYRAVKQMGKKEFTLLKMQEYGFWPAHLATPYEKQKNETQQDFEKRKDLLQEYDQIAKQIAALDQEKSQIIYRFKQLRQQYNDTWDYDQIRRDVSKQIMLESIERRAQRKKLREAEKLKKTEAWKQHKAEQITYIGRGYSNLLGDRKNDDDKLNALGLPLIDDDRALAQLLELEYKELRFLAYHRDVVVTDHYHRYTIDKRSGGTRNIAAPKVVLKQAQKKILELILEKIEVSEHAHGFLKGKSVVSGADVHIKQPKLLINMDLENFFPTLTFARVRGMFHSFGYSGYLSSILAMLCTYCERMPMEIKGEIKYVKASERILPQGSPASPMITNIICRRLDQRILSLAKQYQFHYSRYADDLSLSFDQELSKEAIGKVVSAVNQVVLDQGFLIKKEKTRYLRNNNRQCITGVVINNEQLGVPKVWLKKARAAIYNANQQKVIQEVPAAKLNEIAGMIGWLKTVNQERYLNLIDEGQKLLNECKK